MLTISSLNGHLSTAYLTSSQKKSHGTDHTTIPTPWCQYQYAPINHPQATPKTYLCVFDKCRHHSLNEQYSYQDLSSTGVTKAEHPRTRNGKHSGYT